MIPILLWKSWVKSTTVISGHRSDEKPRRSPLLEVCLSGTPVITANITTKRSSDESVRAVMMACDDQRHNRTDRQLECWSAHLIRTLGDDSTTVEVFHSCLPFADITYRLERLGSVVLRWPLLPAQPLADQMTGIHGKSREDWESMRPIIETFEPEVIVNFKFDFNYCKTKNNFVYCWLKFKIILNLMENVFNFNYSRNFSWG